jgi:hypothetical protein
MEKEVNKILERLSMEVISLDEARAEMRILGLFNVVGRSEQLACIHDVTRLRLIGKNITCLDCQTTWIRAS